jgi:hypothetical protein
MPSIQVMYPLKQEWRKNLNLVPNALPPCKSIKKFSNRKNDALNQINKEQLIKKS